MSSPARIYAPAASAPAAAGVGHNNPPAASNRPVRLAKSMADLIRSYREAAALKSKCEKDAKAAESVANIAKLAIVTAMGSAVAAVCGEAVVTRKDVDPATATVTLDTGESFALSAVQSFKVNGQVYDGKRLAKVYGGRGGYVTLNVVGEI